MFSGNLLMGVLAWTRSRLVSTRIYCGSIPWLHAAFRCTYLWRLRFALYSYQRFSPKTILAVPPSPQLGACLFRSEDELPVWQLHRPNAIWALPLFLRGWILVLLVCHLWRQWCHSLLVFKQLFACPECRLGHLQGSVCTSLEWYPSQAVLAKGSANSFSETAQTSKCCWAALRFWLR